MNQPTWNTPAVRAARKWAEHGVTGDIVTMDQRLKMLAAALNEAEAENERLRAKAEGEKE